MLSKVSVTSGRILSSAEAKRTSLIVITIFNNGIQFRIGEEETLMEMISADIKASRYYKLPGREAVRGPFLYKCFDNHINNQHEKLINREEICGLHFQGDGATDEHRFIQ